MADYVFKYRLASAPSPTLDGSGVVQHDIWAISQIVGNGDWAIVPGRHKTICIPADQVQAALASANPVNAYKTALAANLNTQPVPVVGWDLASLEALMDANDESAAAAADIDYFITVTLHQTYPLDFSL